MSKEVWKEIEGFPLYEVSNLGRVRSWNSRGSRSGQRANAPVLLKSSRNDAGYHLVTLSHNAKRTTQFVHKLVAKHFLNNVPGLFVLHNNGDQNNNRADNLRYGDSSDNNTDTVLHGHHRNAVKVRCKRGHKFTRQNTGIRPDGRRYCKLCRRDQAREYRKSSKE